jgi:type I restriction enzyme S subunit
MSNNNQHIPAGYKLSPLGSIPEDWEVKKLGEVCAFLRTNTLSRNQLNDTDGEVRNIHYGDVLVKYPSIIDARKQSIPFVNQEDYKESMNDFIEDGDIVLADTAEDETVGKACEIANIGSEKILSGLHTMLIRPQKGLFFPCFLGYQVNSVSYRKQLNALIQGIKVCSLGKQAIANTYFAVPPLPEQQRIVSVLSLWDTAIAKQTALIEQLTLRKRGLMQQLLTGKKRLKGFEGEWKEVRLGEVASINRGGSPRPIEDYITDGDGYNWIKIGDVGVDAKYITRTEEKIIKEGLSKTRFVKSGDFILSNSMSFGRPYILKIDGCIHDGWLVIQEYDKTFNIDFLYYILGYDTTLAQYKSMAAGSGVLNLNKEIVKEVMLKIPSIDEQKAIATILVESDKEIELANKKLEWLQEEKRGLMQVLLTGKKRIK